MIDFKPALESAFADDIALRPVGDMETQVFVPFYFPDGDGFVVHIRRTHGDFYEITDKANTIQHLSYHLDSSRLRDGTRGMLLEQIQHRHGIEDRDGELVLPERHADQVAASVFGFVHAIAQVSDLRFLERELARSTFRDDLRHTIKTAFPEVQIDYVDPAHDTDGKYPIDFVLNGTARPIAIFAVPTSDAAMGAVIIAKAFQEWGRDMFFVAVQEDQSKITGRTRAWLTDTVDKQFSSLVGNEEFVVEYLRREHEVSRRLSSAG